MGSARFRAFAEGNRAKIHKKLGGARDDESLRDVRAELQVAHLLLADRRIEVAYEAYGSGKAGPDFTITYRATRTVNVEVTRMQRVAEPTGVAESIVAKLRQLPPSVPNILVLAVGGASAEDVDVAAAAGLLSARADAKDEAFFEGRGPGGDARVLRPLPAPRPCHRVVRGGRRDRRSRRDLDQRPGAHPGRPACGGRVPRLPPVRRLRDASRQPAGAGTETLPASMAAR